jgi:hypothetical protein
MKHSILHSPAKKIPVIRVLNGRALEKSYKNRIRRSKNGKKEEVRHRRKKEVLIKNGAVF